MDEPAIFSVQEAVSLIWLNSVFAGQSRRNTAYTNVLCVITESKYDRYLRRVIGKTSFSEFGRYALVPNYSAPRWIIPLGNRRVGSASLRLYNPQSLRGKIFKQIVSNL